MIRWFKNIWFRIWLWIRLRRIWAHGQRAFGQVPHVRVGSFQVPPSKKTVVVEVYESEFGTCEFPRGFPVKPNPERGCISDRTDSDG